MKLGRRSFWEERFERFVKFVKFVRFVKFVKFVKFLRFKMFNMFNTFKRLDVFSIYLLLILFKNRVFGLRETKNSCWMEYPTPNKKPQTTNKKRLIYLLKIYLEYDQPHLPYFQHLQKPLTANLRLYRLL